jgi:bifunctional non-homologous end joining protein LigD
MLWPYRFHSSLPSNGDNSSPSGPGWAHELKHDGYRLQVHVRDGRVKLYTINGADWSRRYPRIIAEAARLKHSAESHAAIRFAP